MVYYTLYLSLKANRQKLCWKVRIYADENLILILKWKLLSEKLIVCVNSNFATTFLFQKIEEILMILPGLQLQHESL